MPVSAGTKVGVNLHAHRNNMRTRVLAGCAAGASGLSHVFDYEAAEGGSPLHDAVGFGATAAAAALLAAGAEAGAADATGITPLHLAAGRGMLGAARACLAAGAERWRPPTRLARRRCTLRRGRERRPRSRCCSAHVWGTSTTRA